MKSYKWWFFVAEHGPSHCFLCVCKWLDRSASLFHHDAVFWHWFPGALLHCVAGFFILIMPGGSHFFCWPLTLDWKLYSEISIECVICVEHEWRLVPVQSFHFFPYGKCYSSISLCLCKAVSEHLNCHCLETVRFQFLNLEAVAVSSCSACVHTMMLLLWWYILHTYYDANRF